MRIYISGPVTGQEDTAKKRFKYAAKRMKEFVDRNDPWPTQLSHTIAINGGRINEVINPFSANAKIAKHAPTMTHADYMTTSIAMLAICDAIYMMRGWEQSEGCKEELQYAKEHGYKIIYEGSD